MAARKLSSNIPVAWKLTLYSSWPLLSKPEWRVIVDQVQTNYHGRPVVLYSIRCDRVVDYEGSSLSGDYGRMCFKSVKNLRSSTFLAKNVELIGLYPIPMIKWPVLRHSIYQYNLPCHATRCVTQTLRVIVIEKKSYWHFILSTGIFHKLTGRLIIDIIHIILGGFSLLVSSCTLFCWTEHITFMLCRTICHFQSPRRCVGVSVFNCTTNLWRGN